MKLNHCLFILLVAWSPFVFSQSQISDVINQVCNEGSISRKGITKLSDILKDPSLGVDEQREKWVKKYMKVDQERLMETISLPYLLHSDESLQDNLVMEGYSKAYLLQVMDQLLQSTAITEWEYQFLESLLYLHYEGYSSEVRKDTDELFRFVDPFLNTDQFTGEDFRYIEVYLRRKGVFEHPFSLSTALKNVESLDDEFMEKFNDYMLTRGAYDFKLDLPRDTYDKQFNATSQLGFELGQRIEALLQSYWWHPEHDTITYDNPFSDWSTLDDLKYQSILQRAPTLAYSICGHLMIRKWKAYLKRRFNESVIGKEIASVVEDDAYATLSYLESALFTHAIFSSGFRFGEFEYDTRMLIRLAHAGIYPIVNFNTDLVNQLNSIDVFQFPLSEKEFVLLQSIQTEGGLHDQARTVYPKGINGPELQRVEFRYALYLMLLKKSIETKNGWLAMEPFELPRFKDTLTKVDTYYPIEQERINQYNVLKLQVEEVLKTKGFNDPLTLVCDGMGTIAYPPISKEVLEEINVLIHEEFAFESRIQYLRLRMNEESDSPYLLVDKRRDKIYNQQEGEEPEVIWAVEPPLAPEPAVPVMEEIYDALQVDASFPTGASGLSQFIFSNIRYPIEAIEKDISGKVYLSFVVEIDGEITGVRVERSADPILDAEAIRIVKSMPKWNPAKVDGRPVRSRQRLPIDFKLE